MHEGRDDNKQAFCNRNKTQSKPGSKQGMADEVPILMFSPTPDFTLNLEMRLL